MAEQVNTVIDRAKQQEQIEVEQKRAAGRKHRKEACWQTEEGLSPLDSHEVKLCHSVKSGVGVRFTLDWLAGIWCFLKKYMEKKGGF